MDCFAADRCGINGKIKKFKTSKPEDCVFWNKLNTLAHETLMLKRNFDLVGRNMSYEKQFFFGKIQVRVTFLKDLNSSKSLEILNS